MDSAWQEPLPDEFCTYIMVGLAFTRDVGIGRNMTRRIVAIVGMAGAGKSEVAATLESLGLTRIRFGDVTEEELERRGLSLNEANERSVREDLRREHGMAAYAILNLPKIDAALESGSVVVDGLYSWEEYLVLREQFGSKLIVLAIASSPATRAQRLASRPRRPLSAEEVESRDRSEIEKINKGGPIAIADITVVNESSIGELDSATRRAVEAYL